MFEVLIPEKSQQVWEKDCSQQIEHNNASPQLD